MLLISPRYKILLCEVYKIQFFNLIHPRSLVFNFNQHKSQENSAKKSPPFNSQSLSIVPQQPPSIKPPPPLPAFLPSLQPHTFTPISLSHNPLSSHQMSPRSSLSITKPTSTRKKSDFLRSLPPDLCATIIDLLRDDDLRHLPQVCKSWASLFTHDSPLEPSLRHFVRRRFGLHERPPQSAHLSWGQLYLTLRKERCHLCPALDVAPCVYAGSSSLAVMLECGLHSDEVGLALFPVCKKCFTALLKVRRDAFVPVVERTAVHLVFPGVKETGQESIGFLYSDIPTGVRCGRGIEYVLARPLADICTRFRRNCLHDLNLVLE